MTQIEKMRLRADILAVITVYDTHTPPENRGPWRDRVVAFADTLAPRDFEHEVVRRGALTTRTLPEVLGDPAWVCCDGQDGLHHEDCPNVG